MKVLLVNGSPHKRGTTHAALIEIEKTLKEEGVDAEIFHIGDEPVSGCRGCRACAKLGKCVVDDVVNDFIDIACACDGFVFGTPVHYAAAGGAITSFLDRAFYAAANSGRKNAFLHKPGAAVACARRAGTTAALDQINKYFTISQMPVISGRYWNMVHGLNAEDAARDLEGMQNMRILARNMAWHLKCREAAEKAGIRPPETETPVSTNFIR